MEEIVDPALELARERAERSAAQRARSRLAMLAEASRLLSADVELGRALAGVAAAARRSVCDACAIEVDLAMLSGRVVVAEEPETELRVALERLAEPVQKTGMAFVAPEAGSQVAESLSPETMKAFRKTGYRSVLGVPVMRKGRPVGTLAWLARGVERFGPADVVVAEDLAGRIGIAIDVRMKRQAVEAAVRERDDRLELLGRDLRAGLPALVVDLEAIAEGNPIDPKEIVRVATGAARLSRRLLDLLDGAAPAPAEPAPLTPPLPVSPAAPVTLESPPVEAQKTALPS